MLKRLLVFTLLSVVLSSAAHGQTCPNYPYALSNGATADANQVMGNFSSILTCANTLATTPNFSGPVAINNPTVSTGATLSITPLGNNWNEGIEINPSPIDGYSGLGFRTAANSITGSWELFMANTTDASGSHSLGIALNNLTGMTGTGRADTPFSITTGGVARFGGNVGIGATSPANALDVNGSVAIGGYAGHTAPSGGLMAPGPIYSGSMGGDYALSWQSMVRKDQNATTLAGIINATSGSAAAAQLYFIGGTGYSYYGIDLADNSGSPFVSHFAGSAVTLVQFAANSFRFTNPTTSPNWLTINSSGNVGIGNASPSYLLHVGSATASGVVAELQNASGACTHTPGASSETVSCSSDLRLKTNVEDASDALPRLDDMRVRDFTIKATGERKTGIVAQELTLRHPEMVHKNTAGLYSVDEPNPWLLVKAVQELHSIVSRQQTEIEQLRAELAAVRAAR